MRFAGAEKYGLTPQEFERRRDLLRADPFWRGAQDLFLRSSRVRTLNTALGLMISREELIFTSSHPERVVQQAAVALRTSRRP
jgi:hypothetical protein